MDNDRGELCNCLIEHSLDQAAFSKTCINFLSVIIKEGIIKGRPLIQVSCLGLALEKEFLAYLEARPVGFVEKEVLRRIAAFTQKLEDKVCRRCDRLNVKRGEDQPTAGAGQDNKVHAEAQNTIASLRAQLKKQEEDHASRLKRQEEEYAAKLTKRISRSKSVR